MAGNYNLIIDQGCTFAINVKWIETLSGYSAKMQIRDTNTEGDVLAELSSPSTGITIIDDILYVVIDATTTLTFPAGRHCYSLVITHTGGAIHRVIEGFVDVIRETTRVE
jgi:hypothetical protein